MVEQAKAFHIALVDTGVLLRYVADQLKVDDNSIIKVLTETAGELPYRKPHANKS